MINVRIILSLIAFSLLPLQSFAVGERMGEFSFAEFSLSPRMRLEEPSRGGFDLKESWISFEWKRDQSLSGEISFGSADLVAPAIWFQPKTDNLALVKAAIQAKTEFLDFRAGFLEIPVNYEGSYPEWEWSLPATRVLRHRWFTKRDYGFEIRSETKPFLTTLTVHNGESGPNLDNRMWYTGMWQIKTGKGYGFLATATTGQTDAASTAGSLANTPEEGFNFDPTLDSKVRYASFAAFRRWQRHLILLEAGRGDVIQNDQKNPFSWGHLDFSWNVKGDLNLLFRIEQSHPDMKKAETKIKTTGLGLSVSSKDRLSSGTLFLNRNQENPQINNDEAFVIFRLNSNLL